MKKQEFSVNFPAIRDVLKQVNKNSATPEFNTQKLIRYKAAIGLKSKSVEVLPRNTVGGISEEKKVNHKSSVIMDSVLLPVGPLSASQKMNPLKRNAVPPIFNSSGNRNVVGTKKNEKQFKKFKDSYSKITEIKLVTVGLASPARIRQWAERTLPGGKVVGEVINAETLHYKTFKPIKGGLFCERIFGPIKDHECACGKKFNIKLYLNSPVFPENTVDNINNMTVKNKRYFCDVCYVEYTYSTLRRTQLGYIKLATPVTHSWFVKGGPNYMSILLDMKKRDLQHVIYNFGVLTLENSLKGKQLVTIRPADLYQTWAKVAKGSVSGGIQNNNTNTAISSAPAGNQNDLLSKKNNLYLLYKQNKKNYYGLKREPSANLNYRTSNKFLGLLVNNSTNLTQQETQQSVPVLQQPRLLISELSESVYRLSNVSKFRGWYNLIKKIIEVPNNYKKDKIKIPSNYCPESIQSIEFNIGFSNTFTVSTQAYFKQKLTITSSFFSGSLNKFKFTPEKKQLSHRSKRINIKITSLDPAVDWRMVMTKPSFLALPPILNSKNKPPGMPFNNALHGGGGAKYRSNNIAQPMPLFFLSRFNLCPSKRARFTKQALQINEIEPLTRGVAQKNLNRTKNKTGDLNNLTQWKDSTTLKKTRLEKNIDKIWELIHYNVNQSREAPNTIKLPKSGCLTLKPNISQINLTANSWLGTLNKNEIKQIFTKQIKKEFQFILELQKNLNITPSPTRFNFKRAGAYQVPEGLVVNLLINYLPGAQQRNTKSHKFFDYLVVKTINSLSPTGGRLQPELLDRGLSNLSKQRKRSGEGVWQLMVQVPKKSDFVVPTALLNLIKKGGRSVLYAGGQNAYGIYLPWAGAWLSSAGAESISKANVATSGGEGMKADKSSSYYLKFVTHKPIYNLSKIAKLEYRVGTLFGPKNPPGFFKTVLNGEYSNQFKYQLQSKLSYSLAATLFKSLHCTGLKKSKKRRAGCPPYKLDFWEHGVYRNNLYRSTLILKAQKNLKISLKTQYFTSMLVNSAPLAPPKNLIVSQGALPIGWQQLEAIMLTYNQDTQGKKNHSPTIQIELSFIQIIFRILFLLNTTVITAVKAINNTIKNKSVVRPEVPAGNKDAFLVLVFSCQITQVTNKLINRYLDFAVPVRKLIVSKGEPLNAVISHPDNESPISTHSNYLDPFCSINTYRKSRFNKPLLKLNLFGGFQGAVGREYSSGEINQKLEVGNSPIFSLTFKNLFLQLNKAMIYPHKLLGNTMPGGVINNLYCFSHRHVWDDDQEKNWRRFTLYFYPPNLSKSASSIPIYQNRTYDEIFSFDEHLQTTSKNIFKNNSQMLDGMNINTTFSGAGIIQKLLNEFNFTELKKMDKQNRILLFDFNKHVKRLKKIMDPRSLKSRLEYYKACQIRDQAIRRTKIMRKILHNFNSTLIYNGAGSKESLNMILTVLPVLPPDLRPIVKTNGKQATADLNTFYKNIIYRNERLKKFLKDPALNSSFEMKYAQRLVQEAVDNLIQNGKGGVTPVKDARGRLLKSLSEALKGKQGRFRQYLLGKRVDYSARSVIVVGPRLKLHECGIPKEIAVTLYLPFLIKRILNQKIALTVPGAKGLIQKKSPVIWQLLREIMKTRPVLLNRAPTLHRLGFQAFRPILVEGKAILLHPLVCPAFNADFDGDQMAVHIPITAEATAEAWKLMLSRNNLLSPATGEPLILPSQDMVLGCYYLTTNCSNMKFKRGTGYYFHNLNEVIKAYQQQVIDLHAVIWVNATNITTKNKVRPFNSTHQEQPLEIRIRLGKSANYGDATEMAEKNENYSFSLSRNNLLKQTDSKLKNYQVCNVGNSAIILYSKSHKFFDFNGNLATHIIRTTTGKIVFNKIIEKALTKRPKHLSASAPSASPTSGS